jgi:hypothetical protein
VPVVAAQLVALESTPLPLPGKSEILMVVLGAAVILIAVFIGISSNNVSQLTRKIEKFL